MRTANGDFAGLAQRHRIAGVVQDRDFGRWQRQADGTAVFGDAGWIGASDRRCFGQAVTFDNRAAGNFFPFVRNRFLHCHAATNAYAISGEIQLGEIRMIQQGVVQRIDRRESVDLVLRHFLDQAGDVARIRDQQIQGALAHAEHAADRQCKDVIQRQGADKSQLVDFRAARQTRREPGFGLQHVGNDIAMRQCCALGDASRAACILQESDVVRRQTNRFQLQRRRLRQYAVEWHRTWQRIAWHHFLDMAHHQIDQQAFDAHQITHAGNHHMLDFGPRDYLLQRSGEVFQDEDGFRAGIIQLMLELTRRI